MTGQPPKLNPVAAPTGSYAAPAQRNPKLLDLNFDALAKLSGTLMDYAAAKDSRAFQESELVGVQDAARLNKEILPVLTGGSELTQQQRQEISKTFTGVDNPYAVLALRQAAAVQQVRNSGLRESLTDPEWLQQNVRMYIDNKDQADAELDQRVQQHITQLGALGPVASEAAQNAVFREVENFKAARANLVPKVWEENKTREVETLVGSMTDRFRQAVHGSNAETNANIIGAHIDGLRAYIASQRSTIGEETAEKVVLQGLRSSMLALADSDGEMALTFMDSVRDAWDNPTTSAVEEMDRIDSLLSSKIQDNEQNEYRRTQKAASAVQARVERAMRAMAAETPDLSKDAMSEWLFRGPGDALVKEIAAEFKVSEDAFGDIRTDMLEKMHNSIKAGRQESDQGVYRKLHKMAREHDPNFEAAVEAHAEDITNPHYTQLWGMYDEAGNKPSLSQDAKESLNEAMRAQFAQYESQLPPELAPALQDLGLDFRSAYRSWLDANPQDYEGAIKAARSAVRADPRMEALEQGMASNNWPLFAAQKEVAAFLKTEVEAAVEDSIKGMVEKMADGTASPVDQAKLRGVKSRAVARMRAGYEKIFNDSRNLPAYKALPSTEARKQYLLQAFEERAPDILQEAMQPAQGSLTQAALDPDLRIKAWERENTYANVVVEEYTKLGPVSPSVKTWQLEDSGRVMDRLTQAMSEARSGKPMSIGVVRGDLAFLLTGSARDDQSDVLSMEVALSAAASDGFAPKPQELRWGSLLDRMASGIPANPSNTYKPLLAVWAVRGLSLDELASGTSDFGVDLKSVFSRAGTSSIWQDNFMAGIIPVFNSVEEMQIARAEYDKDPENSKLGQAMVTLGLSKGNLDKFLKLQEPLMATRGEAAKIRPAYSTNTILQGNVPSWAAKRIDHFRSRNAVR